MAQKRRAPYRPGDRISILFGHPNGGTCLGYSTIDQIQQADGYDRWTITYQHPTGETRNTIVNSRGTDRTGYIERATA